MQSIEARKEYKNSFVCATRIFKDEGILTFWSGALPRLVRLVMSGGIVFTMCVFFPSLYLLWNKKQEKENSEKAEGTRHNKEFERCEADSG